MRVDELLASPKPLLEGKRKEMFDYILPALLIEEDDAPPSPDNPPSPPDWFTPGPLPGGGMNIAHWANQLFYSLKNLAVTTRILKRFKVVGVSNKDARRVKKAAVNAAKSVKHLLTNPGAYAYRIPVWTTATPPKPVIKKWNEAFAREFEKEMLLELVGAKDAALTIAANFLRTKIDKLEEVDSDLADAILDDARKMKQEIIKTGARPWVIVHYRDGDDDYARVEAPDGAHKLYKVA